MSNLKKTRLIILTIIFALTISSSAVAHELWFDLDAEGEVGKEQVIKLKWGDFGQFLDPRSRYFDAIAEGELWVLTPDGQRIDLELQELPDRYEARFTPQIGGDHQVIFYHDRGVLDWQHGGPQGMQSAANMTKAFIDVEADDEIEAWDQVADLDFEIKALTDIGHLHTGAEVKGQLLYLGEPLADNNLLIYYPGGQYEEPLRLNTDQDGKFSFKVDVSGPWLIKTGYFDDSIEEIAGEAVIGARFTYTMVINPHDEGESTTPVPVGGNSFEYLYLIAGALFAGAGYLFGKTNNKK